MPTPDEPKIYHIVHVDRLTSIAANGGLLCDAKMMRRGSPGTTIGMNDIKQRRLKELTLTSHPDLYVGECVPFYFCPRSVMLYVIYRANDPELAYRGGQEPIVHLEADLRRSVAWADDNSHRWTFSKSNAGARYFEDFASLEHLDMIDWDAVQARDWSNQRDAKQAEFLMERSFPWELISRIGVRSRTIHDRALRAMQAFAHHPPIEIKPDWYY